MKAFIWNSEGFRDTTKHLRVQESIRDYNLDIVALLETGRSRFQSTFYGIWLLVGIFLGFVYLMEDRVVY